MFLVISLTVRNCLHIDRYTRSVCLPVLCFVGVNNACGAIMVVVARVNIQVNRLLKV